MSDTSGALAADREFFKALTDGNGDALNRLLADDFILIDVMRGMEVAKTALVELVGSGQLKFESITPADVHERRYGPTAIVSGRTTMRMRFEQTSVTVQSRYVHIYIEDHGSWRMVSAQGTQIAEG
ncbi:MAG: nuclear transport factor 2 family protein [Deltaproteobacteria bacterium]|nr:nuclear transport factor 2 family protein [Deltaproteobacteria bacterium]